MEKRRRARRRRTTMAMDKEDNNRVTANNLSSTEFTVPRRVANMNMNMITTTKMAMYCMAGFLLFFVLLTAQSTPDYSNEVDAFSPSPLKQHQQQYHHHDGSFSPISERTTQQQRQHQRRRKHGSGLASSPGGSGSGSNNVERLQFKIYPDGRIEETVLGVKGSDCQKITERINEALGEVISSQPTEEMFEQEIQIDQTLTNSNVENGGGGGSGDSWDGASSW